MQLGYINEIPKRFLDLMGAENAEIHRRVVLKAIPERMAKEIHEYFPPQLVDKELFEEWWTNIIVFHPGKWRMFVRELKEIIPPSKVNELIEKLDENEIYSKKHKTEPTKEP